MQLSSNINWMAGVEGCTDHPWQRIIVRCYTLTRPTDDDKPPMETSPVESYTVTLFFLSNYITGSIIFVVQ